MRALLYKELLAARAYLSVSVLLALTSFVTYLLEDDPLGGLAATMTGGASAALFVTGGIAFAVGHGQVAAEVSRGHIEFLDGLPVGRFRIFSAKLLVGLSIILLLLCTQTVVEVLFMELAFDAMSWPTLLTISSAHFGGLLGFYGAGLLLSWLGGLGWVVLGVGVTFIFTVAEISEGLRPLSLMHGYAEVRFEANVPMSEVWPERFWAAFGLLTAGLSGLVFAGPGAALLAGGARLVPVARLILLLIVGPLLVLIGLGALMQLGDGGAGAVRTQIVGPFRVLLPVAEEALAEPVLRRMPEIDAAVRRWLEVETPFEALDVELLGGGRYHAGVYTGGKVRIALQADSPHLFAHELAHAYAHRLATDRSTRHMDALRFFNEGLAMWVAERAVPGSEASNARFRSWAGAVHRMGHSDLEPLMQDKLRSVEYDGFEAYPLGLVFVEAAADAHSDAAVPCLIRAISTLPDRSLPGHAVWSHLASQCGVSMKAVARGYVARLDGYAAALEIPLPVRTGQPVRVDGELRLRVEGADERDAEGAPVDLRCRFRAQPGAKAADMQDVPVIGGQCRVPISNSTTNTVSFQVGRRLPGGWVAYGPWLDRKIPR